MRLGRVTWPRSSGANRLGKFMRSARFSNDRMNVPVFGLRKQALVDRAGRSGQQLAHQSDVAAHGFVRGHAAQLRPGLVLGGADEVEKAGPGALEVAFGALLVEGVQFQQGVVVGAPGQVLDIFGSLVELTAKIAHGAGGPTVFRQDKGVDSTRPGQGQRVRLCVFPRLPGRSMSHAAVVPVLTIDGPSGSGKGTVSALVAERLGWRLLDSGALYRAVGYAAGMAGLDLSDVEA